MTDADLVALALNSFDAAFVDDADRARWRAEVAAWTG
jgi:adenosine deaminase